MVGFPADPNTNSLRDYKDLAIDNFTLVLFALLGTAALAP
jgi:hypothetical protein